MGWNRALASMYRGIRIGSGQIRRAGLCLCLDLQECPAEDESVGEARKGMTFGDCGQEGRCGQSEGGCGCSDGSVCIA